MVGREASFRYNLGLYPSILATLWLVGKRRSDTMMAFWFHALQSLWLVGKRRSDTMIVTNISYMVGLWLVGKRRSDTMV